jgi:hypothetical protein
MKSITFKNTCIKSQKIKSGLAGKNLKPGAGNSDEENRNRRGKSGNWGHVYEA